MGAKQTGEKCFSLESYTLAGGGCQGEHSLECRDENVNCDSVRRALERYDAN